MQYIGALKLLGKDACSKVCVGCVSTCEFVSQRPAGVRYHVVTCMQTCKSKKGRKISQIVSGTVLFHLCRQPGAETLPTQRRWVIDQDVTHAGD